MLDRIKKGVESRYEAIKKIQEKADREKENLPEITQHMDSKSEANPESKQGEKVGKATYIPANEDYKQAAE